MKKTFGLLSISACMVCMLGLMQSCNVTRRTTVESSYYSKGDTTVQITSKTIESYDASKKGF